MVPLPPSPPILIVLIASPLAVTRPCSSDMNSLLILLLCHPRLSIMGVTDQLVHQLINGQEYEKLYHLMEQQVSSPCQATGSPGCPCEAA